MEASAVLTAINTSVTLLTKLRDLTKTLDQVDIKTTIAELANELADAKLKVAELSTEIAALKVENAALKAKSEGGKPKIKWGCYKFEGEEGLFCPACYDTKGKKHLTTRMDVHHRRCSVCNTVLGSG